MSELPSKASVLLDEARAAHEPSVHDLARNLDRLHARLGYVPLASSAEAPAGVERALSTAKQPLLAKSVKLVLAAALAAGVGHAVLSRSPQAAPERPPVPPTAASAASPALDQQDADEPARALPWVEPIGELAPPEVSPEAALANTREHASPLARTRRRTRLATPAAAPPTVSEGSSPSPANSYEVSGPTSTPALEPQAASHLPPAAQAAPTALGAPVATVQRSSAARELDLIDEAWASLRADNAGRALSALDRHRASYEHGAFALEREGMRVLALCKAGRKAEGRALRERFLRSASGAPIAARVRQACAGEP